MKFTVYMIEELKQLEFDNFNKAVECAKNLTLETDVMHTVYDLNGKRVY